MKTLPLSKHVNLKMSAHLYEAVDRERQRWIARHPGQRFTMSDVLRMLIAHSLKS